METNADAGKNVKLKKLGQELLDAAYAFWKEHKKRCGPRAVVWLRDTSGHFVLFTRGEYLDSIMAGVRSISEEAPLDEPFVDQ